MASAARGSAAPAVLLDSEGVPSDGDERAVEEGIDPVLWRGPRPSAEPAKVDTSASQGGRSHAPL